MPDVVVTRVLNAPVERVWRLWSDSADVMRWWGPAGFTAPLARMDFREGGTSLVCMRAPAEFGGQDTYNTWTYQKIVPHQRIEFVLSFSDRDGRALDPAEAGIPPGVPRQVRHVVRFEPDGGDKTTLTVTEYGFTTEQAHDMSKMGMEQCVDKMAAILE